MISKKRLIQTIFSILCVVGVNACFAEDFSPIKTIRIEENAVPESDFTINLNPAQGSAKTINLSKNDTFYHFVNATDRFVQCNIRASWEDFRTLINTSPSNDFVYMSLANKMADLGLFDLATLASSKIKDNQIGSLSTDAMHRFYYPRRKLKMDDELFLAENYSNILYNDQSSEATNELLKNEVLLSNSDYANYLVSLGFYKSNVFPKAAKYINIATIQNPTNLNYQTLKAKILAENNEPEEALKIVDNLKKQKLYSYEYERKIKSLEQFVLYKTKKADWEKNYHLGYYYYIENDSPKAIRTLQTALSSKRKCNSEKVNALMSEIYLSMNEFEKAADTAKKAYKSNKNNPITLVTMGDLSCCNKDYKQALKYYKQAASQDKSSYKPLVKEAQTYQKLSDSKKANELYTKILKTHSDSWEAYYNTALISPDKEKQAVYLKKALAVNPLFKDGWIELSKTEINNGNYDIAQKYLANAFYIDENDFRYYYYQGLVNHNMNDLVQAKYNFKKCLKLNPNNKDAQRELDTLFNEEASQLKQENI